MDWISWKIKTLINVLCKKSLHFFLEMWSIQYIKVTVMHAKINEALYKAAITLNSLLLKRPFSTEQSQVYAMNITITQAALKLTQILMENIYGDLINRSSMQARPNLFFIAPEIHLSGTAAWTHQKVKWDVVGLGARLCQSWKSLRNGSNLRGNQ